jgi:hypothetical protein
VEVGASQSAANPGKWVLLLAGKDSKSSQWPSDVCCCVYSYHAKAALADCQPVAPEYMYQARWAFEGLGGNWGRCHASQWLQSKSLQVSQQWSSRCKGIAEGGVNSIEGD